METWLRTQFPVYKLLGQLSGGTTGLWPLTSVACLTSYQLFKYQSLVSSDFLLCLSPQICRPMRAALLLEGSDEENLLESSMLLPVFSAIPWAFPLLRGE